MYSRGGYDGKVDVLLSCDQASTFICMTFVTTLVSGVDRYGPPLLAVDREPGTYRNLQPDMMHHLLPA